MLTSPAAARQLGPTFRVPALLLWALFLASQPFYVSPSGLPQPGDVLLLPLIPLALAGWNGRLSTASVRPMRLLLAFTLWVCVVNGSWMVITGDIGLLSKDKFSPLIPLFYIYNALVVLVALVLYERFGTRFLIVTMRVLIWTAVLQVGLSFLYFGTRTVRATIFFNNPNQLGYYAMLSACAIALCQRKLKYGVVPASIGMVSCTYLALLSASKAAVAGTVILFALMILTNPRVIFAVALGTGGMLALGGPVARAVETLRYRATEDRRPDATFFQERGYDRIRDHKEYLIFGAGEGATTRFADGTVIGTHEIHSSAGTIVFAYGIVGSALFLAFLVTTAYGASLRLSLILLPALLYAVAHQGLRFTSLWVLLALFVTVKQHRAVTASAQQGARRAC